MYLEMPLFDTLGCAFDVVLRGEPHTMSTPDPDIDQAVETYGQGAAAGCFVNTAFCTLRYRPDRLEFITIRIKAEGLEGLDDVGLYIQLPDSTWTTLGYVWRTDLRPRMTPFCCWATEVWGCKWDMWFKNYIDGNNHVDGLHWNGSTGGANQ